MAERMIVYSETNPDDPRCLLLRSLQHAKRRILQRETSDTGEPSQYSFIYSAYLMDKFGCIIRTPNIFEDTARYDGAPNMLRARQKDEIEYLLSCATGGSSPKLRKAALLALANPLSKQAELATPEVMSAIRYSGSSDPDAGVRVVALDISRTHAEKVMKASLARGFGGLITLSCDRPS